MSFSKELMLVVVGAAVLGLAALIWKPVEGLVEDWHKETQVAMQHNIDELEETNNELKKMIANLQELSWTRNGRAKISNVDFGQHNKPSIKINHKGDAQHYEDFSEWNLEAKIKLLNRENGKWIDVILEKDAFKSSDPGLLAEINQSAAEALGIEGRIECEGESDNCEKPQPGENDIRYQKIKIELSSLSSAQQ